LSPPGAPAAAKIASRRAPTVTGAIRPQKK
jgi:hypothetical protein